MNKDDLKQWKEKTDEIDFDINRNQIQSIMKKAHHDQMIHRIKSCCISILFPLFIFIGLVNTSQDFVSAINGLPLLTPLVRLLEYNPSIYLARNDEIFQKVDQTFENEDFSLYIESMVADESQIVLFYKINPKTNNINAATSLQFKLLNAEACYVVDNAINKNELDYIAFLFDKPKQLKKLEVEVFFNNLLEEYSSEKISLVLENDLTKTFPGQEYAINKTLNVENQIFTIENIIVYPLRTIISTKEDPKNSKDILNYDFDIILKDKTLVDGIKKGVSSTFMNDYEQTTILESPYLLDMNFELRLNQIEWINKEDKELVFDVETETFEHFPTYMHYFVENYVENSAIIFQIEHLKDDSFLQLYPQSKTSHLTLPTKISNQDHNLTNYSLTIEDNIIKDGKIYFHNDIGQNKTINQSIYKTQATK